MIKKGKSILLVNQSSGYLMVDIANAFVASGKYHTVVLASGNLIPTGLKLSNDVVFQKIARYNRKSVYSRLISWVIAIFQLICLIRSKYSGFELLLVSNPPTITFLTKFIKNKYSVLVYDIYPDGLFTGGFVSRESKIYRIWQKENLQFFNNARAVFTITEGMAKNLSQYCTFEKIKVVSLWSNSYLNKNVEQYKLEEYLTNNNLKGKFIIQYSGNIGKGHDLICLIEVANLIKSFDDIVFVFIGEGYMKAKLMAKANEFNVLQTCRFLSYQPIEMLPYTFSGANIAVVSTNNESGKVCVPSKTFDLLSFGKPILSISKHDSEISEFVIQNKIGQNFESNEIYKIRDFILNAYKDNSILREYQINAAECSLRYTSDLASEFVEHIA